MPKRDKETTRLNDRLRFEHMLAATTEALAMTHGRVRADLSSDVMLRRATINAVQEIGEAATRISESGRALVPELPWGRIVRTRNLLVHEYWGVDLDRVWAVVTNELPELPPLLERAIAAIPLPPNLMEESLGQDEE